MHSWSTHAKQVRIVFQYSILYVMFISNASFINSRSVQSWVESVASTYDCSDKYAYHTIALFLTLR